MITDAMILKKSKCRKWISDLDVSIIAEINERVFIETFIGRVLVIINYFVMRKLVNTTGANFLPNYTTESSKYVVLLTWIVFSAIVLVSVIQLILKNKSFKNKTDLSYSKIKYYEVKLKSRSTRVLYLVIFYIILYQIIFQSTITNINIGRTILWWIIILNVLIIVYMGFIKVKYYLNVENMNSDLEEIVALIEKGDFKSIYTNLEEKKDEYIMLGGNEFDIIYTEIEELISLTESIDIGKSGSLISKTELITNVSHDLKTPLTSIINYVDFLKKGNLSEEDKKSYIDILDRKSKRLKILIEDLKESTAASSGKINLECSNINLKDILEQALLEYREKIETSSLNFDVVINSEVLVSDNSSIIDISKLKSDTIKEVFADKNKMLRVFQNIISNILKYSLKDSKVYIKLEQYESVTSESGYYTMITFRNTAANEIKIKEEELIERFRRGDSARNTEGSGLGLDIAKSLVEVQGGEFKINIDKDMFTLNIIL